MKWSWLLLLFSSLVEANLWQNTQQKAQSLFDRGAYIKSAEMFEDSYRQGVAYYRAGDFKQAIEAFKQQQRPEVAIDALYNLSNSYFYQKDYVSAYRSFRQLLKLAPNHLAGQYNHAMTKAVLAQIDGRKLLELENEDEQEENKHQQKQEQEQESKKEEQQEGDSNEEKQQIESTGDEQKDHQTEVGDSEQLDPRSAPDQGDELGQKPTRSDSSKEEMEQEKGSMDIRESTESEKKQRKNPNNSAIDKRDSTQASNLSEKLPSEETAEPDGDKHLEQAAMLKTDEERRLMPWLKQIEEKRVELLRYQFQQQEYQQQQQGMLQEDRPW